MSAWPTVRLGEVIRHRKGSITIDDATTYKLCRVQLHRRGVVLREHRTGAEIRTKKQQVCRAGDFLVAEMDAKVGGYGFVPPDLEGAIVSSHYFLFELDETRLWPGYLEVVAQAEILQRQIVAKGSTNYAAIRPASVLGWEIPLPPLAVQKRMAANFTRARAALATAEQEIARQEDWVAKLKQAILQEAITGRLTAGWRAAHPDAEPASRLLARIRAEKARLVAAKKLRPEKPLPPIPESETPFALPEGWAWCRLGEIGLWRGGGTPTKDVARFWGADVPWITPKDMKRPFIDDSQLKLTNAGVEESSAKLIPPSSILFVVRGMILAHTFPVAVNTVEATVNQDMKALIPFVSGCEKFLRLLLDASSPRVLRSVTHSTHGTCKLETEVYESFVLPLPPLAEQTEIVARVEGLMERCRELEGEIERSRAHAAALLHAVLREAFAPADTATTAQPVRPAIKPLAYLLQFLPALVRAAGGSATLDQLNRATACLFLPKADLVPVLEKLSGPEARAHFADFSQTYEEGAFAAALRTLLKARAFTVANPRAPIPTLALTDNLPPISPDIDTDARHLAPLIERVPDKVIARSAPRLETPRARETLLQLV